MFIVTRAPPKHLAPLGAKPSAEPSPGKAKAIALLRSFGVKKGPPRYKHLAPLGQSNDSVLLHFKLEFATEQMENLLLYSPIV